MLLTEDIDTLVIHINLKGKKNHENERFCLGPEVVGRTGMNLYFGL
jgi:hypothetical protein